ncbi:MAG: hypothetical protein Q4E89_02185 [Eubacteriales bacterium]|nr:hypothetical protein [Eubacteriales bacterium]
MPLEKNDAICPFSILTGKMTDGKCFLSRSSVNIRQNGRKSEETLLSNASNSKADIASCGYREFPLDLYSYAAENHKNGAAGIVL